MKRPQPPTVDGHSDQQGPAAARRRLAEPVGGGRYMRAGNYETLEFLKREAAPLFASWYRAERGLGSDADARSWARFSVIDPWNPDTLERIAAADGVRPSVAALHLYEPLWAAIAQSPSAAHYIGSRVATQNATGLPSFADAIDALVRVLGRNRIQDIQRVVARLGSPDQAARGEVAKGLVGAIAEMLDTRPMGEWGLDEHSFYTTPLPPGSWAQALHALALADAQSAAHRCDPRHAYYILAVRTNPNEPGDDGAVDVFLAAPHLSSQRNYQTKTATWHAHADAHGKLRSASPAVLEPKRGHNAALFLPPQVGTRRKVLGLVEDLARALASRSSATPSEPNPAGIDQILRVLAPLGGIDGIPPTTGLAPFVIETIANRKIGAVAGAWIDECQLVAALALFHGQTLARRASPLFDGRPSTLFDAAVDASVASTGYRPPLPADVIERSGPRLWQRVCSAPATNAGTLAGADLLVDVAHAWGIAVGNAEVARPELLCQPLAPPMVRARMVSRYGPSPLSPLQQSLLKSELDGVWRRTCQGAAPVQPSPDDLDSINRVAQESGIAIPTEPVAYCAVLAPVVAENLFLL
ncbi:hypothetical protein pneo_cds_1068 [Pandoravirus neocaledonia]|uniref:Uncharacterized protein n=1 Tax=Pandoravirus neocaledonia TaxID=2107708 RepID=A0A2U7UE93_9VIRU|nr:hypothetical protein pneo_cds_1068 [Pandoravirus neocaledonia]AVK76675.1 hypothetical protein pneo_cds_1068 [Pandoravirus neocaledonia]